MSFINHFYCHIFYFRPFGLYFQTTVNNIEVSLEYIQSLRRSLSEECAALLIQNREIGKDKLESCLSDLGAVTHKFKDVLDVSNLPRNYRYEPCPIL